jgi:hypothetical protein
MAIATLDQYVAAYKQRVNMVKTASATSVALIPWSLFNLAGDPAAGTIAGASTNPGVVPTDATTGCPFLNFTSGNGYITKVEYGNTVTGRINIYDVLYKVGAFVGVSSSGALTPPSYLARTPDGAGNGCEIWVEDCSATTYTANLSIAVTYTSSTGATAHTTGTVATGVMPTLGRMIQLPLQSGDSGVQKIESVTVSVGTLGSCNVLVLRPLVTDMRVRIANEGGVYDIMSTGMPMIYSTSALYTIVQADAASTGLPHVVLEVASA